MEFEHYLANRHLYVKGYKGMKEVSAKQYANRFSNIVKYRIYNFEKVVDESIVKKINERYANRTNEYVRTLKYYLEYRRHLESANISNKVEMRSE